MLLLTDTQLSARRTIAAAQLRPLADALAADLAPLLARDPLIPTDKALLSRVGGRCETDGTDLEFDPFQPHAHRCPRCGRIHTGEWHDRWWLYPYQLWLAERAVHAAALFTLRGESRHGDLATAILTGYAAQYLRYPNRDNVLGPSRVFFSTYLESLWLLHITIAADLLDHAGDSVTADTVRDHICAPGVQLIEQYNEGTSNRQVWNNAAICAAHAFMGAHDSAPVAAALADTEFLLANAVGADGSWYEGDNYHQFAHRGLWYAVALGERLGYEFQAESLARFHAGFAAPFRTALPDFTYPARKDSRYAASLRQWRFAESCELGLARGDDPVLRWALERMYADDAPAGDTGRSRSTGEAERHAPAVRLTRADLGWRSLLFALPQMRAERGAAPGSLTVESQGYSIHRRERGDVYVALDWGPSGGGHGHPDRLNLTFVHGATRWLDDLGTGSYVDPSLHWYRSTLAHNAPLVGGASQARVDGECLVRDDAQGFDIISARVDGIAPGVRVERTIVTHAAYFVDEITWHASQTVRFELPTHFDAAPAHLALAPAPFIGGVGLEDGFSFVRDARSARVPAATAVQLSCSRDHRAAMASVWSDREATWFAVRGPGQPASDMRAFNVIRCEGERGTIRTVWAWRDTPGASPGGEGVSVASAPDHVRASFRPDGVAVTHGGVTHVHESGDAAWSITLDGGERVLFARPADHTPPTTPAPRESTARALHRALTTLLEPFELPVRESDDRWFAELDHRAVANWAVFELGDEHYRRTEESWDEAGAPGARVAVALESEAVVVDVFVATPQPVFVPIGTPNPLDNEQADINGHGIQVYFADGEQLSGWVVVPDPARSRAGVRWVPGWGTGAVPVAEWRAVPTPEGRAAGASRRAGTEGFELRLRIPHRAADPGYTFGLDVIVNDAAPGRSRRRGQLVLSGGHGEFAYLRGDRHDPSRMLAFAAR